MRRAGEVSADVPEPPADPHRGEPVGGGGFLPRPAEVFGERPGEPELGVGNDQDPGPAVRGLGSAEFRGRPAEGLLREPERVLKVESAQINLPASRGPAVGEEQRAAGTAADEAGQQLGSPGQPSYRGAALRPVTGRCGPGLPVRGFARGYPVRATDHAAHRVAHREARPGAGHHEPGEQADTSLPQTYLTAEPRLVSGEGAGVITGMGRRAPLRGRTRPPAPCWTRRPAGLSPPPLPRAVRPVSVICSLCGAPQDDAASESL